MAEGYERILFISDALKNAGFSGKAPVDGEAASLVSLAFSKDFKAVSRRYWKHFRTSGSCKESAAFALNGLDVQAQKRVKRLPFTDQRLRQHIDRQWSSALKVKASSIPGYWLGELYLWQAAYYISLLEAGRISRKSFGMHMKIPAERLIAAYRDNRHVAAGIIKAASSDRCSITIKGKSGEDVRSEYELTPEIIGSALYKMQIGRASCRERV